MPRCRRCAANGASSDPVVSADGRYVAFLSQATNLVGGAHSPDSWINVYVRDTVLGTTTRMQGPGGEPLGDARSVDMSDDGRYVVFVSDAPNLAAGDANDGCGRVHRRPRRERRRHPRRHRRHPGAACRARPAHTA